MARTSLLESTSSLQQQQPDLTSLKLTTLLSRLSQNLLPPNNEPTLQTSLLLRSPQHRTRTLADIEYARTLLLQLEHQASGIKIQRRKQTAQADLLAKRKLVRKLRDRVEELGREGENLSDDNEEEDEDLLSTIKTEENNAPDSTNGTQDHSRDAAGLLDNAAPETLDGRKQVAFAANEASTTPLEGLRNRHGRTQQESADTASTTALHNTERTLASHTTVHESLTSSLLALSGQLKSQSLAFASSLENEKSLLDRAAEGLERNTGGMQAAGQRMGVLRRMSEGRGWLGRMLMYLWIFGLWIVAILLVFVGPKLRF